MVRGSLTYTHTRVHTHTHIHRRRVLLLVRYNKCSDIPTISPSLTILFTPPSFIPTALLIILRAPGDVFTIHRERWPVLWGIIFAGRKEATGFPVLFSVAVFSLLFLIRLSARRYFIRHGAGAVKDGREILVPR